MSVHGPQLPQKLVAIEIGHHEIDDDQIGFAIAASEALRAVLRDEDLVPDARQDLAIQLEHHRVIIDNKDPGHEITSLHGFSAEGYAERTGATESLFRPSRFVAHDVIGAREVSSFPAPWLADAAPCGGGEAVTERPRGGPAKRCARHRPPRLFAPSGPKTPRGGCPARPDRGSRRARASRHSRTATRRPSSRSRSVGRAGMRSR